MRTRFPVLKIKSLLGPLSVFFIGLGFTVVGTYTVWRLYAVTAKVNPVAGLFSVMALTGIALLGYGIKFSRDISKYDMIVIANKLLELRHKEQIILSVPIEKGAIRVREMKQRRCVIQLCKNGNGVTVASNLLQDGESFTKLIRDELGVGV